jgi:hypothetical protein
MCYRPELFTHCYTRIERENACAIEHFSSAALEIRLRRRASFQEKLRQLFGKYATKKGAGKRPFRWFQACRIRGKLLRSN